jgi:nucleoside-diphosphate-sugar epimerase
MKILVTGATGFVGRHVVPELLKKGHDVVAVARDADRARMMPWYDAVHFVACDLHAPHLQVTELFDPPDALVHLAWAGLPNYRELYHFEVNLPADYRFLKSMIMSGTKHVLVTGTCLEYGMQSGPLSEDMPTFPANPYGLAKDTLRKFLETLQNVHPFVLQWVRLFYMYGPGQNPNSLLSQLDKAIDNNDAVFNMSGGEQLRDYLHVETVAEYIVKIIFQDKISGIVNCCSGKPISVRGFVEKYLLSRGRTISLNLGYYPYPEYEPMAFWGDLSKLTSIIEQ